ncbi:MAG: LapB repeat-containing protein, partial [Coprobacillaceae bacterium]
GVVTGVGEGTTTVTITVTDIFGNVQTGTINVTVGTNKIPTITVGKTTDTLELGSSLFDAADYITAVSDVEDTTLSVDDVVITGTPVLNQKGSFTLTYTITDSDGNYASEDIVFTVIDTTDPVFTITNTIAELEINGASTLDDVISQLGSITKFDNDSEADLTIKSDDFSSLDQSTLLNNPQTITIYVEDPSGNSTSHTVSINIVDTTNPVFTITNTTVELEVNGNTDFDGFLSKVGIIETSDNSLETMTIQNTNFSSLDQTSLTKNPQTVTMYVEDSSGNRTSHVITVNIVDTTNPVFTITNTTVELEVNGNTSFTDFLTKVGIIEASDNSLETMTVQNTNFSSLDQTTLTKNPQTVTMYVEDSSGNRVSHTITVNIKDTTNPEFTVTNTIVELEVNGNTSFTDFLTKVEVTKATDNSKETMVVKSDDYNNVNQSTLTSNPQTTTIYVEDSSGNRVSYPITVNIVDTTKPVITTDLVVVSYRVGTEITEQEFYNEIGLQVSDNSLLEPSVISDFNTVDFNPTDLEDSKTHTVTITVTDSKGNIATKEIQVNIVRNALYYIEGKDVELTMNELTSYINDNTLEDTILNISEAKAWKADYLDGITDLPVYIKDISALKTASAGEEVTLDLVLTNPKGKSSRDILAASELESVVGTITVKVEEEVTITDGSQQSNTNNVSNATNTSDSMAIGIDKLIVAFGIAIMGILTILKTKKSKD